MTKYSDEEKLELTERIWVTKDVKKLLKNQWREERKKGRKISLSKLVCNALIQQYAKD